MDALISPELRRRAVDFADHIVNPPRSNFYFGPSVATSDRPYGIKFCFLVPTTDGKRLGYAQVLTAHGLLSAEEVAFDYLERTVVHKMNELADREGTHVRWPAVRVEAFAVGSRGRDFPI